MLFFILWTKEIREADERNKNYNLTKSHLIGEKATRQEGPGGMPKLQRTAFLISFFFTKTQAKEAAMFWWKSKTQRCIVLDSASGSYTNVPQRLDLQKMWFRMHFFHIFSRVQIVLSHFFRTHFQNAFFTFFCRLLFEIYITLKERSYNMKKAMFRV